MGERLPALRFAATILLTLGLLVIGGFNIQQKRIHVIPDDGCFWIKTTQGVQAEVVVEDGPCERAGVLKGDLLRGINKKPILSDQDVAKALYDAGVYSTVKYTLERNGGEFESTAVIIPPPGQSIVRKRLYLEIIGIFSLIVGAYVLLKRVRAAPVLHFYFVCLTSFVLFTYSYTGKLDALDWSVFWLDTAAIVFLPPLFLHFCLEFPSRHRSWKHRRLLLLLYLPGALLMLVWATFVYGFLDLVRSPVQFRQTLETTGDVHFGVFFVASAVVLFWTYQTVRTPDLRQQMKWVTRGVTIGVLPYFLLQSLPRAAGIIPDAWVDVAVLPLMLIPTSFGYAISRYKLADADVIFKRGVTYTLATASVVTLIILAGQFLGSGLEWPAGPMARVGATIIAALLFSPIKDQFQIWLDKLFYGERYSVRRTLVDFGRTLGAEVRSENLLDRIVDRLSRAFSVDHAAVFLESPIMPERFLPALVRGVETSPDPDLPFLKTWTDQPYLFFQEAVLGFNYFIPCRTKNRVIAYIAFGQTQKGDYLNSEDLELLEAMSDYVGIALENSRLYKSLEQRASEYHDLKDFSENIIESINVGVVVEDVNGRMAGWNKALEKMTGLSREDALGKRTEEAIPRDFLQRLSEHRHLYKQQWNGLTVNFSVTSLVDKAGATRGRLIIIDDITDRIRLEDQLVQNEKLTSIGLLAAGVAHEVNTPLAVISSYSQMLRKQIPPADAGYKLLEKITAQTFRASEIVNNLLSFSRVNATEFALVNIHKVINETLSLLEHPLKTSQIRVTSNLLAEAPTVSGNAGKLQQVFLNLFLNARDAMPDGGVLDIRTATVDGRIEIVVTDSGAGISREHIKKIYDPFFTTKTAGKGTGLGLSVSYGIVQEHGGSISVESGVGQGTSFRLDFPLSRKVVNV
jgi:two-component system, NtrC family, sensor kinase